ncbi:MAG: hypothetical protein ACPG19_03075 [Saprospiraceae bacterium]
MKNTLLIALGLILFIACNQAVTEENVVEEKKVAVIQDYTTNLETLKADYQRKLDTGVGMLGTSIEYSAAIDSMVILLYTDLSQITPKNEASDLAKDQKRWFTARENAFQEEWKKGKAIEEETGIFPQLEEMVAYGVAFDVSYKKAIELNEKLNN